MTPSPRRQTRSLGGDLYTGETISQPPSRPKRRNSPHYNPDHAGVADTDPPIIWHRILHTMKEACTTIVDELYHLVANPYLRKILLAGVLVLLGYFATTVVSRAGENWRRDWAVWEAIVGPRDR